MYEESEPLKRGQNLIDSMTSAQRQKFEAVVSQLKVEWAVSHGDLSPIIVEALCKRAALDMDVSAMTVGAKPTHNLRQVAKNIGDKEPFLQASIDARDAELILIQFQRLKAAKNIPVRYANSYCLSRLINSNN